MRHRSIDSDTLAYIGEGGMTNADSVTIDANATNVANSSITSVGGSIGVTVGLLALVVMF